MANIKSAKKRILTNERSRLRNKVQKTGLKTAIKKLEALVAAGNKEEATVFMNTVAKKLDSGVTSGIVHKNYASRQKSRLMKKVNAM